MIRKLSATVKCIPGFRVSLLSRRTRLSTFMYPLVVTSHHRAMPQNVVESIDPK
ncbi:hypothetical protein RSAG8_10658, partial [Rhizoctonia solani AG-8 WAC10335]